MKLFTPKKGAIVATVVSIFLMIVKFIVAISSGSVVVLASAIDSLLDVCISGFNYFALKKTDKPANKKFNYGFDKIQYIATTIEGLVIFISAGYIFYKSVEHLQTKTPLVDATAAIWIMIFSTIVVGCLILFLNKITKFHESEVTKADILHYKSDLFSNGAILISLIMIEWSDFYWMDPVFGIFIALYIAYSALKIVKSGIFMLLDRALDEHTQNRIINILNESAILGYYNLKTRIVGNKVFMVVYLVFDERITLLFAHDISDNIEMRIKAIDMSKEWEIIAHLEPIEYFKDGDHSFKKGSNLETLH
ncbi:cation diffusion facilitator family transporter [Helicobacter sp. 11S03491-1]|uniref:cation diffusion facilitator family transporter n=1 Tax=Helicobacter sp. 11S03491-1 TaxID=1476196 RepID=UPI000BA7DBD5|nr:cation diffusion facilitator family transporter [Helicobacter sp. 11S03491-1]PAF43414.1 hypothetical protein BKH45_01945 [Helicobacter sp. 11S03491-1]